MPRISVAATLALLMLTAFAHAGWGPTQEEETASAVVEVVTEPELAAATLRFTGLPAGALVLNADSPARLSVTGLAAGTHASTLGELAPAIQAAGYELSEITCDDGQSAGVSSGDLTSRTATFRVEDGESVKCVFRLTAGSCICPKQGVWHVQNHLGAMVCTGTMSMTLPLAANRKEGNLEVRDGCSTIVASGMSDEATMTARVNESCGFEGSAGGEEGGMPLTVYFTFVVETEEHISGALSATVSQQGTTCEMNRTFELDFGG